MALIQNRPVVLKPAIVAGEWWELMCAAHFEMDGTKWGADPDGLLPSSVPLSAISPDGEVLDKSLLPSSRVMLELYQRMVIGRRFDVQASALAKQGLLAVFPSSRGQEACQVAPVVALDSGDWLFPTYRDSVAIFSRDVDPIEVLTLFRGDWHSGYDPYVRRVAPQCTPLATHMPHAVGLTYAARMKSSNEVALVLLGDGATSEGDAHEAFNLAAVWRVPVVFLVQNNGFAISVPNSTQFAAQSLAHKAIGYGIPGKLVDGNDAAAIFSTVKYAVENARSGGGPCIIEALTYRIEPHTNADDPTRYREDAEVETWRRRDPIERLRKYLISIQVLDEQMILAIDDFAEEVAKKVRVSAKVKPKIDPHALFEHVYERQTLSLNAQRRRIVEAYQ